MIATINKTAARKRVALARTNVNASRRIEAKVMKPKRKLNLTLEPDRKPERENPALGRVFIEW
jgi:hypothetical protein